MITFQTEKFADFHRDAEPLFPKHYEELTLNKGKYKQALYVEKYLAAETAGILLIVTARDEGHMFGYYIAAILPHLHYKDNGLMASTDMYFIDKEYRKGNIGFRFVHFIEERLKEKEVGEIYVSCKVHSDLQKFWEAMNYTFTDKMFRKSFN
jgi:GNAT superfamily N-acetyltransferase